MQGFIYLWRDRKHNRFYVGCHWGDENDGYVCSSTWMLQAYKKRPQDFKRRVLERFEDRSKANEIEHRWLQMIKTNELKGKRYYNFHNYRFGHWSSDERSRMTVGQKISDAKKNPSMETRAMMSKSATGKKRTFTEEHKRNISIAQKGVTRKGSPKSEATKLKMSLCLLYTSPRRACSTVGACESGLGHHRCTCRQCDHRETQANDCSSQSHTSSYSLVPCRVLALLRPNSRWSLSADEDASKTCSDLRP